MPARADGFILLEVLVALAVLVLALGTLFQALATGAAAARGGGDRIQAVLAAESLLASVGADGRLDAGDRSGVTADGARWRLKARRHRPAAPEGLPQLWEVTVTVQASGRPVTLATIKLLPMRGRDG